MDEDFEIRVSRFAFCVWGWGIGLGIYRQLPQGRIQLQSWIKVEDSWSRFLGAGSGIKIQGSHLTSV